MWEASTVRSSDGLTDGPNALPVPRGRDGADLQPGINNGVELAALLDA